MIEKAHVGEIGVKSRQCNSPIIDSLLRQPKLILYHSKVPPINHALDPNLFHKFFFYPTSRPSASGNAVKMFSLARRRREAERHKKLEEQFLKKDANGNGRITAEQMVQIFEENEVQGEIIMTSFCPNVVIPYKDQTQLKLFSYKFLTFRQ